jgi:hypothetical protein
MAMMLTKPGTEVDGKGLCVVSGFVSEWTMAPSDDWSGASFTASFVDGSKVRFAQASMQDIGETVSALNTGDAVEVWKRDKKAWAVTGPSVRAASQAVRAMAEAGDYASLEAIAERGSEVERSKARRILLGVQERCADDQRAALASIRDDFDNLPDATPEGIVRRP